MMCATSEAILSSYEEESSEAHRYVLKELLGQGVFGSVFKGRDTLTKKTVAIKVSKLNNDETLKREIEVLNYISYSRVEGKEGLVQLKDHFKKNGRRYLVYELLGSSIENYITNHSMTLRTIKKIAFCLCLSIRAMSEIGIIHGDLKLDNIVFSGRKISEVKIIDFGLAQICRQSVCYPIQALYYRAPEVMLKLDYGKEIDMWSLGCILFTLLTRLLLIKGKSEVDCMNRIVQVLGMPPKSMIAKSKLIQPGSTPLRRLAIKEQCDGTKTENQQVKIKPKLDLLLNLIEQMLKWEPEKRITPLEALQHQFFLN